MKKIIFLFLNFILVLNTVHAQTSIDFNHIYQSGNNQWMNVDSSAKEVYFNNKVNGEFNTSFNYMPGVNNLNIELRIKEKKNIQKYRYTILQDEKPIVVNKQFDNILDYTNEQFTGSIVNLGVFPMKGKSITTLIYNIEKPLDIYKNIYYSKEIPKAKILSFSHRLYSGDKIPIKNNSNETTNINFSKDDFGLRVTKDKSVIDNIYAIVIKDKRTNEIIYNSTAWKYDLFDSEGDFPYIDIEEYVFPKSGEYEIIIRPSIRWESSSDGPEKYIIRQAISVTLAEESFSEKDLIILGGVSTLGVGAFFFSNALFC